MEMRSSRNSNRKRAELDTRKHGESRQAIEDRNHGKSINRKGETKTMTDNNNTPYNSQEAPTKPTTDADRIKALEDRIKRLESRIEAITQALKTAEQQMQALTETAKASEQQMQTIMEALNPPEPEPAEDPARIAARAKYDAAPEELKRPTFYIPPQLIEDCINAARIEGQPYIFQSDLYQAYRQLYKKYPFSTRLIKAIFILAVFREGYPEYNLHGVKAIWIDPDTPKPKAGKRARRKPEAEPQPEA